MRLYAFLSQILPFADASLEKLYVFARLLARKVKEGPGQLPREIQQQIDMDSYRVQKTSSGRIALEQGQGKLEPMKSKAAHSQVVDEEALSAIIKDLNERFGTDFTQEDRVFIEQLEARLSDDKR